jgi:hypothetical protein
MVQTCPHSVEVQCHNILLECIVVHLLTTTGDPSEQPLCEPIPNPRVVVLRYPPFRPNGNLTVHCMYLPTSELVDDFREKTLFLRDEYSENRKLITPIMI